MCATSTTLLDRLRTSRRSEDWERFVHLYSPMILRWARRQGLQAVDAADLAQDVLVQLVRLLPSYQRGLGQSFRGWLSRVTRSRCLDFHRRCQRRPRGGAEGLDQVADSREPEDIGEREYRTFLLGRGLDLIRGDFEERTWQAFEAFVLHGRLAAEVAAELGLTANAVYLARTRILARLRRELDGLLE